MPDSVLCQIEDKRWQTAGLDDVAERATRATLAFLGHDPARFEISLLGCSDARIADLNADFRGKPVPTNVLSWPSEDLSPKKAGERPQPPGKTSLFPTGADMPIELGDIAIAFETCQSEADKAGLSLVDHTTHLIVHGVLHLLGYDHVRDQDATLMEGLETDILGSMGLDDPYRDDNGARRPHSGLD